MGRTDQVLTGGSLSLDLLTTTMKAVLALLLVCLVQISFAEQEDIAADGAPSDTNLLLQREVREAAKGKGNEKQGCDKEGKKCKRKQKQMKKKNRKRLRKQQNKEKKNRKKNQTRKAKKSKKGGKKAGKKGGKNKEVRKSKGKKKGQRRPKEGQRKKPGKPGKPGKKDKKERKNEKKSNGPRSSSASGNGRNTSSGQCFTDMVAKTKKFNRAQVEFRLCKRIETWGKLMKNKKNNSASTFSDALEAMNEATGNGKNATETAQALLKQRKFKKNWRTALPVQETTVMRESLPPQSTPPWCRLARTPWRPLQRPLRIAWPSHPMMQ